METSLNLMPMLALLVSLLGIVVAVGLLAFTLASVFGAWRKTNAVYMATIRDLARVVNYAAGGLQASSTDVPGGVTPQEYLAQMSRQEGAAMDAQDGIMDVEEAAGQPGTGFVAGG